MLNAETHDHSRSQLRTVPNQGQMEESTRAVHSNLDSLEEGTKSALQAVQVRKPRFLRHTADRYLIVLSLPNPAGTR